MNNIRKYSRLVVAIATLIASLGILAVIIYYYADYERNVILNTNIDDFTIVFNFIAFFVFSFISAILFALFFKEIKREKEGKLRKKF